MKPAKHTPGPWEAVLVMHDGRTLPRIESDIAGENWIADLPFNDAIPPNAHLIAAAPVMLTELEKCVAILNRYPSHDPNGEVNGTMAPHSAVAAIAKAKGGAS